MHQKIPYQYKNLPIPGGGYVTGFLFSKNTPDILYIRTDIGGTYRYSYEEKRWHSLIFHVTMKELSESFPAAIALDETAPETLYVACGIDGREEGVLAVSHDGGGCFDYFSIPALVHGNLNGRGTGLRLVVDPSEPGTLYFASQQGGLLRSENGGRTWEKLEVNGEEYLTMIWVSQDGNTLVVGTAGITHRKEHERGHSLYVSYNRGEKFIPLAMPENQEIRDSRLSGLVAQRYDFDGTHLYITLSVTGSRSYVVENGYSCDSGDAIGGMVLRYNFDAEGKITGYTDISPTRPTEGFLEYGFSGISSCALKPGILACSTICKNDGDMIFLSYDSGNTWKPVLFDLQIGKMEFRTPYMRPECNGGHSLIHWLSDIKINPFNPDELWFNSGTGVFVTRNLTEETVIFTDWCDGLEETVHLNIYSVPSGEVKVIDILGDLGGFAFRDLDTPCDNSFADVEGNRYITCINADFSDVHPETVIVTPRGNWTGKTKGGLILSKDQCKSFHRLPMPFGLSEKTDQLLRSIENPNVNAGWVAMSPDCKNIVWSIADMIELPGDAVVYSHDGGESFCVVKLYNTSGQEFMYNTNVDDTKVDDRDGEVHEEAGKKVSLLKVFSDRVNSSLMYGFGENSRIFISRDGGATFWEKEISGALPAVNFGLIDCANKTEIRVESGKEGSLYLAVGEQGLWKMDYHLEEEALSFQQITTDGDEVYRIGLGLLREGGDYISEPKALYICGILKGEYGFFRSLDQGESWQRINDDSQMFGDINSMDGDCRTFGRFYLATGSLGAVYGDVKLCV